VRPCACGTAVQDDEGICPACNVPVQSTGRRGRLPAWIRVLIGLVIISLVSAYWWFLLVPFQGGIRDFTTSQQEQTAKANLQILHNAQRLYRSEFGTYAPTLAVLGPPGPGGAAGPGSAALIAPELAAGDGGEYFFNIRVAGAGYVVTAVPRANSQAKSFWCDQTGEVRVGEP
jgi:hypothetical protein